MKQEEMNLILTKVKDLLKEEVTNITFDTWINPIEIQKIDDVSNTITLVANSQFMQSTLQNNYHDLLRK